jgi:RNA polymerase sigma-70 factor (ECF subfamily)
MASGQEPEKEVSAFLRGDPALFASIRAAIRAVVRSFRFRGDAVEQDLVQDVLSRVFVNLSVGAFRGEAALSTYAQRVARYACLEHIRKRRVIAEVDPQALPTPSRERGPEESLLLGEKHRHNLRALAGLTPECRELFRLIFIEGWSQAEIAGRLGISETAVKLRVHRCRLTARAAQEEPSERKGAIPRKVWRHYEEAEE